MAKRKQGETIPTTEREEMITRVGELDIKCKTQRQIAEILGISTTTVTSYLKVIKERYVERQVGDKDVWVQRKLDEYRDLRREAWEAYERSKRDAERESEEWGLRSLKEDNQASSEGVGEQSSRRGRGGKPGKTDAKGRKNKGGRYTTAELIKVKATKMRQGRLPGVEYLRLIADTYKAEREMLGLDEALKLDVKAQVLDWSQFVTEIGRTETVEQKMAAMLNQLPPQTLLDHDAQRNGGWEE